MLWNLDNSRPIFLQIVEHIQNDIVCGKYKPGDKIPSVREFAELAAVNPNTMQKALATLESTGLVITQRSNGRYITTDQSLIDKIRNDLASTFTSDYVKQMKYIGFKEDEILSSVKQSFEGGTL